MKVAVLNAAYDHSASPFKEFDPDPDPSLYIPEHTCTLHHIHKATAIAQIRDLVAEGYDVFINLCDGAWDEDRAGIEVIEALERFGAAYTGANAEFYEPSREVMKLVCSAWDIPTPGYVIANRKEDAAFAVKNLRFPMIVKHPSSYGSIGLTKKSRVTTPEELQEQVEIMISQYGGALIEEFIEGREFTVLVGENCDDPMNPFTFPPVEYVFPKGETFKHFDMKWIEWEGMDAAHCENPELAAKMQDLSKKMFLGLNGRGYGRTDIRVTPDGQPYILEINPNCSIFYPEPEFASADNILKFDADGHAGFLRRIIKAALYHQERRKKKFRVIQNGDMQFGIYATTRIKAGQVIIPLEQQPQNLVSRTYARKNWSALEKSWFKRYATPITDEVYATWSNHPTEWKPINHSCNPNAWLTGLDVTARRTIAEGEEITLDYATFCNELMKDFKCGCGSPNCRKRVKGTDYMENFVDQYGDHVSDYVRQRRKVQERISS